jgi:acetyltransferase-like isoleucine patch superfamily enzyme
MLLRILEKVYERFIERKRYSKFVKEFRSRNKHNQIFPVTHFPVDIVSIGSFSYGELNLFAYDQGNKIDSLKIGNFVSISSNVRFLLHENHQTDTFTTFPLRSVLLGKPYACDMRARGPIVIDDEVWIGQGATILSGVSIGKGAIIAAGAVVSKDVPPYAVAGGVPARIIKYRFDQNARDRLLRMRLSEVSRDEIIQNIDLFYSPIDADQLDRLESLFERARSGRG